MMENIKLDTSVQYLKGVGPKMFELLNKLGIYTVRDLIEYYPRTYDDRTKILNIKEFIKDQNALFIGRLIKPVSVVYVNRKKILSTVVIDENGDMALLKWYNQVYIRDLTSDIYTVDNANGYFLGPDGKLYIVYAYGNGEYTSKMDIILFE